MAADALDASASSSRLREIRGPTGLGGGGALRLGQPPASGLDLGGTTGRRPADGRQVGVAGSRRGLQRRELGERVGQGPLGVGEGCLGLEVAAGNGLGEAPALHRQVGLGGGPLAGDPLPIPADRSALRGQLAGLQLGRGQRGAGLVRASPQRRRGGRALTERRRDGARRGLGRRELGERGVDLGPGVGEAIAGSADPAGSLVPAGMRRDEEGRGELVAGARARRLLLGLRGEATGLRPELGEDVLDPGQVRLRLDELLLGAPPAALVAADAGDLLEERPALLGPERERLVDHALADEEEGVVGEVGRVEEVDEVLEADPLAIQQVVVLAGPEEPAAELDDAEVDRQQAVGVVEDSVTSAMPTRRPPLRPGEDDVLGLARAQGPALLAERPAEGVGEVALARPVGADDGVDPRPELDERPLGERLEALQPERQQARRGAHAPPPSSVATTGGARPTASTAGSRRRRAAGPLDDGEGLERPRPRLVSALRRDGPTPAPERRARRRRPRRGRPSRGRGPTASTSAVLGPIARDPLGELLEPALGALERSRRERRRRARARRCATSQARADSQPVVEEDRAATTASRAEARSDGRRRPPRWASPSPSRR